LTFHSYPRNDRGSKIPKKQSDPSGCGAVLTMFFCISAGVSQGSFGEMLPFPNFHGNIFHHFDISF
jgi:hypothetical protein